MKQSEFDRIGVRGIIDDDLNSGFVVSKADKSGSIIKQFTDCTTPERLDMEQVIDLLTSILESTFGSK